MTPLVPIADMSPEELASQLGEADFPAWLTYQGQALTEQDVAWRCSRDPAFLLFWTQRAEEEVSAFRRILREGDFLDTPIAEFFDIPLRAQPFLSPPAGNMRDWAEQRLTQAEQRLAELFS